jgi:hypothetical protein
MIEKAVGAVPHTGGKRFDEDSELLRHAAALARGRRSNDRDPAEVPQVESWKLPQAGRPGRRGNDAAINGPRKYSDGTDRDVTSLA